MCYVWVQISIAAFGYHIFTYLDPTKIRTIGPLLALFNQEKSSLSCVTFGLCSCVYHNLANYCCHRWHRKVYVWWTSTELHCKMFFQWNHWCFKNTICRGTDFFWFWYQWLSRLDSMLFYLKNFTKNAYCTKNSGPQKLVEGGKLSFPSGHSACSFAAGTFAFLQLGLAFQRFYHPLLLMLSMIFPIVCAGSRYVDGYHHLHDICIGSMIGISIGYYIFNCMIRKTKRLEASSTEIDEMDTDETFLYR